MTMICKNCKFEVQDDSNVCDKCDAEVPKEAKCPNIINDVVCGTLICSNESVCSNCEWSITEKAFETGTRMCYAFKDVLPCQNLVAQGEVCSKCESITEPVLKTDKIEEEVNSSKCSHENVVDSDFCLTDEKGILDTKNTITNEVLCEETPKEVTVNCKSGCNKIVDNIPLTLDGKTHSDKHDKKEENEANVHVQSHPQHVSKAKKENKNNSQSDLHAMDILNKTNSDAKARQTTGEIIYQREEGFENQVSTMEPYPTQNKDTDDVESEGITNAKSNEQGTASYEKVGKRSTSDIELTSSEKAEPNSQENIAEEANGKDSKPDNKARAEYKHLVHGDSDTQKGMQSDEGSSVDPSTQNINRKDNGGTVMKTIPSMPNQVHYNSGNVDAITIKFYAVASNPFSKNPCNRFGIVYQDRYENVCKYRLLYGYIERKFSDKTSWLISVTVTLEKEFLFQEGFRYKYYTDYDSVACLATCEDYFDETCKPSFRKLKLTKEELSRDVWHQHDGILNPTYKTKKNQDYFESIESKILHDMQEYIKDCCPIFCYKENGVSAPEILKNIDMMLRSLENTYCYRFKKRVPNDVKKSLHASIGKSIQQYLDQSKDNGMTLSETMLLLCTSTKYSIAIAPENNDLIYRSFLLDHDANKEIPQYKNFTEEYSDHQSQCMEAMYYAICKEKESDDPIWMCSLPVYHFLTEQCKPFQDIPEYYEHSAENHRWWGIIGIHDTIKNLKAMTKWKRTPQQMIQLLSPMFEIDYLLPRSFIAALSIDKFEATVCEKRIPADVLLAGIDNFLKTDIIFKSEKTKKKMMDKFWTNDKTKDNIKAGIHCLKTVFHEIIALQEKEITAMPKATAYSTLKISRDILQETIPKFKKMKSWPFVLSVIEMVFAAESLSVKYFNHSHKEFEKFFEKCLNDIVKCLEDPKFEDQDCIIVWNDLIWVTIFHDLKGTILKEIKWKLKSFLSKKISTPSFVDTLIQIFCNDENEHHNDCIEVIEAIALEALEDGGKDDLYRKTFLKNKKYADMMCKLFEKKCTAIDLKENDLRHLEFALAWPSMNYLLIVQYEKIAKVSENCKTHFKRIKESLISSVQELKSGTIQIRKLKLILNTEGRYKDIIAIIWKYENGKEFEDGCISSLLDRRHKELEKLDETIKNSVAFADLLQCFEETLIDASKLHYNDEQPLKLFLRTGTLQDMEDQQIPKDYNPEVQIENFPLELIKRLPRLNEYQRSIVFKNIWMKRCLEIKKKRIESITIEEVHKSVVDIVFESWETLCHELKSGDITFQQFGNHFSEMKKKELKLELDFIANMFSDDQNQWIEQRLDQYTKYKVLRECVNGAKVITEFAKEFELDGNFEQVHKMMKLETNASTPMKELTNSIIGVCDELQNQNKNRIESLEIFIKCKDMVCWLQENITSLPELNVFADLATMTAGEGDMEIDRVNFLLSATRGYAPLIFNIDKSIGYKELIEKCKQVWKELDRDPKLPDKLKDTSRNLEWYDGVKQSQGSVEISSMEQAKAINAAGIYVIGTFEENTSSTKMTVEDVLQLHIKDKFLDERFRRRYRYKELQELESKLMLIAGKAEKGKEDVDRFTMVLDSVVRLCNVYIKLLESGCVLFTSWQARFLCDPSRPVCAFIEFGKGEKIKQLKGRRNDKDDVITIMPEIAKFMETSLENWLQYLDEKRYEYQHLNYYTTDQLVILQRELAKVIDGDKIPPFIIPLLSVVKSDCNIKDLTEALHEANRELQTLNCNDDEVCSKDRQGDEIANFLSEMIDAGQKETVARAALKKGIDPKDIDNGLLWCIENEEKILTAEHENIKTPELMKKTLTSEEILSTLPSSSESAVGPLIENLNRLWTTFQTSISSDLSDYLSVEHLAIILQKISKKDSVIVDRNFLRCFQTGEPNLLVCSEGDVFNTVLSIYNADAKQTLPKPDEVLLCTEDTGICEVEIFWRRAMYSDSGKIYCLANVEHLRYDVCEMAEKQLTFHVENTMKKGHRYKMVIICGSEDTSNSKIVAFLEKYRRPPLPLMSDQVLLPYLQEKLKVSNQNNKMEGSVYPAGNVDFESCTVRVIKSSRPGVGKTLYKKRKVEELDLILEKREKIKREKAITIPILDKKVDIDDVMSFLLRKVEPDMDKKPRIFHIDFSQEVEYGVDYLLFQLLILGCLTDSRGYVWRKLPFDLYLVEIIPILTQTSDTNLNRYQYLHRCLEILPYVVCRSPLECFKKFEGYPPPEGYRESDILFDQKEFESSVFQRPFQYLHQLEQDHTPEKVNANKPYGTPRSCLQILLKHSGVNDPSWAELKNFVGFLNTQLLDYEQSDYVSDAAAEFLPGFAEFVLKFLIQMSRDFATRSLELSEEASQDEMAESGNETIYDEDLKEFQIRRTWEKSPHPYLFFNPDRNTMTFVGFSVDRWTGNLIDFSTKAIIEEGILPRQLGIALHQNKVNMNENFDTLTRKEKLQKLCSVMGVNRVHDPDSTYELTMDNVKKILAIYMRFRCDIPVVIMGETGCGKTRLIQFMCQLQCPDVKNVQNMFVMKVHGGTTKKDIIKKVEEAELAARQNFEKKETKHVYTVLFFDEANTTEAVGLIREIMCDKTIRGRPLNLCQSLKIVAACNPYKKHSPKMIKQLEKAGLGFHVDAKKTTDRMGQIPMRWLVYRVKPLPRSLLPFVWDFGQLRTEVEQMYIKQMVLRNIKDDKIPNIENIDETLSQILTKCQEFMRKQTDECSFVSLRDVERVLDVFSWFYYQQDENSLLNVMKKVNDSKDIVDEEEFDLIKNTNDLTTSLVLALGVCYHASLKKREEFRKEITPMFLNPFPLPEGSKQMLKIIERCQDVFLENVSLDKNIAKNKALKENVFMMVVSIELRIPLFLVGKPGSSKSLAKTIVADIMQGNSSVSQMFRNFKQVKMVSFQCSPLSRPEGIIDTFRQCAQFQKDVDLKRNVSVVVLDEVGLAEDSPKMPLKVLHPLLENGCLESEQTNVYKKVGFIGISNWSLDPAKMNRGILVQRQIPDLDELNDTAKGICVKDKENEQNKIIPLLDSLSNAYSAIVKEDLLKREFFGLRDFYSLIKMLYAFSVKHGKRPTWLMLEHSIKRNFGGFEDENIDIEKIFQTFASHLKEMVGEIKKPVKGDPDCSPTGLIKACLQEKNSRYLLLLTENFGALTVLQQKILKMNAITIFGSSFRSDQEYTQICRNINRIKVCMETGTTVILLNLENLYESLYDALNQHYVYFGGERYVDLGLGSHRVKCRVHRDFRLIVVAEKSVVYKRFPIPLINRLEKHFLNISTLLSPFQLKLTRLLDEWADEFITPLNCEHEENKMTKMDVFIGYHADTCASIILHICHELCEENYNDSDSNINTSDDCEEEDEETDNINMWVNDNKDKILDKSKDLLLWCATPDAVLRLGMTKLRKHEEDIREKYFFQQRHEDLWSCILHHLEKCKTAGRAIRLQITTNSNLLTPGEVRDIAKCTNLDPGLVSILSLQSFDTEQQFCRQLRRSFEINDQKDDIFVIIQCDNGIVNSGLIACAHYCVLDELQILSTEKKERTHIVFILRLPRMSKSHFTGFQCGIWKTVHIDDLRTNYDVPNITDMVGKSIRTLLEDAVKTMSGNIIPSEKGATQKNVLDLPNQDNQERFIPNQEPILSNPSEKANQNQEVHHSINKSFDFLSLVKKCVQSSLSMVKYPDNPQRSTQCVNTWIRLLHETEKPDHASFTMGICNHLCAMLMELENAVFGDKANEWVTCEATKREHVNGAGTFRKAMIQYIVQKISPLLAEIISKIDTNQNLDLIDESEESWKRRLWLEILNCPEATNSTHSRLDFRHGSEVSPEFVVLGTRSDNRMFSAKFPFSWIISKLVQSAIQTEGSIKSEDEKSSERIGQICTIIEGNALGSILSKCLQYGKETDLMSAYIHDFLCMDYPVCSENELELVCDNLKAVVSKLLYDTEAQRSGLNCIVATHIAYKKYQCVLQNFHCITEVWPNIQENLKKDNKYIWRTDEEQILDVLGLTLLVSSLEPKTDTFTDKKGRQNWLLTVNKYRPVVEKIFYLQSDESSNRKKELKEARSQWTRVMVVKLFLENVCSVLDVQAKRCIVLWKMLKGEADIKNVSCLERIEKILKSCATELRHRAFRDQQQCKSCESKIVERPVQLPCGDVICANCYRETSITGPTKCPVCHNEFREDFKPGLTKISSSEIKDYETFKTCGDRFYRDVVAQLCFSEGDTPSREVIERLMSHIINAPNSSNEDELMSKNMSILEEGFDQVPVVRSFLLQQILRTSDEVENILETYVKKAQQMFKTDQQKCLLELSVLIINCLEDSFMHKCMTHPQPSTAELRMTLEVLENNVQKMKTTTFGIAKLLCISESRFGLFVTAECMWKIALHEQRLEKEHKKYMEILTAAQRFCTDCGSAFPRLFIVKCICQRFGAECLQELKWSDNEEIRKLIDLPELKPIQWCVDRFVVCGQNYQTVREAMLKSIFGNDQLPLKNALEKVQESHSAKEIHLLLALFREVTLSNLFPPDDRRRLSDKQAMHIFEDLFEKEQLFPSKTALLQDVCRNKIPGNTTLKWIRNNMEMCHQNMICLIFQFYVTLLLTPTAGTLLEPLARLISCPDSVKDVLLPTMSQDEDDDDEIIAKQKAEQVFVEDDSDTSDDEIQSTKVCMPSTVEICELRQMDEGEKTKEKEHVIEDTATQQKDAFDLPSIQCTTLRIFTRIAMYLGASKYPKVINTLLNSTDSEDLIIDNLWSHMEEELLLLQNESGKCEEDVYLLLHYICNTFMKAPGHISDSDIGQLQTGDARKKWGKQFAESFLEKPLRDLDIVLYNLNKNLNEDNRIATDPFMRLLVEKEASEEVNLDKLEDIPVVWRYKSPITLDHLKETLEGHAPQNDFKILRMFLKEERHLKVIRSVPNIIKLQRLLISCYQDKMDRSDNFSIKEAITADPNSDLKEMVNNFLEAWECVREDIATFTFPTPRGKVQLSKDRCKKISMEDHIGYLMPTFQDRGLCSYALLYFLLQKQNTFLMEYCKERRCQYSDLPIVNLKDLTSLHLISFHPTTDILPLIMANCQYTFEIDKGTRQEYIFADLENQLIDRFLFSKSLISLSPLSEFPLMTYACERTNAIVFRELRKKVKQEPLASEVFQKIFDNESTYPDIKTSLKNIDIAISFLKSVGGDISMSLESYLSQTLQIQNPLPVLKDKMICHCKHAQSLWIALSLEQTKHNSSYKEDIFRVIPKAKRAEMNEKEKASVQTIFQGKRITKAKKDRLLEVLFECIALFIDVPEDEDSDVDKNSLRDTLLKYDKTPCYDISSITTYNATDVTDLIKQLPGTIGNTKATDVWLCMYTTLTEEKPKKKSTKQKS